MVTVQTVLESLERVCPANTAFEFDKIGLQVGEPSDIISSAVVALDCSEGLIDFAKSKKAQLALCHHPIIWDPIATVNSSTRSGSLATKLIQNGIAFIGAHTNWDCAPGGINDELAYLLGLADVRPIGSAAEVKFLKLVTFVPHGEAEKLVDALSAAGAGVIGLYERCAFLSTGTGTYRGLPGANPTIGQAGQIEKAEEIRIEMRLPESKSSAVEKALLEAHSYDEPAYDLFPLRPLQISPISRIGHISPISLEDFQKTLDQNLKTSSWAWGDPSRKIQEVAVCGGAADDEWNSALAAGADLFVTGEVRHHVAIEASESGLAIVAAGHYATEHPGCAALCRRMQKEVPEITWHLYEPEIGITGRPLS